MRKVVLLAILVSASLSANSLKVESKQVKNVIKEVVKSDVNAVQKKDMYIKRKVYPRGDIATH